MHIHIEIRNMIHTPCCLFLPYLTPPPPEKRERETNSGCGGADDKPRERPHGSLWRKPQRNILVRDVKDTPCGLSSPYLNPPHSSLQKKKKEIQSNIVVRDVKDTPCGLSSPYLKPPHSSLRIKPEKMGYT